MVFGLIEAELRTALGDGTPLPGLLPEGRAAKPSARAAAAFHGLSVTDTRSTLILGRLTEPQRVSFALLGDARP